MELENRFKAQINQQATQTEQAEISPLPLLSDYVRLDLLNMTTKGVFPDTVPSAEYLKEMLENFSEREGAMPVRMANPLLLPRRIGWEEFFGEGESEDWKISPSEWRKRRDALFYALLTHRGRGLGEVEEIEESYLSLLSEAQRLAEEARKNPSRRVKEFEEKYAEAASAYKDLLLYRGELLRKIQEGVREFEEERKEMLSSEWKGFVEELERLSQDTALTAEVKRRIIAEFDKRTREVFTKAGELWKGDEAYEEMVACNLGGVRNNSFSKKVCPQT